MFLEKYKVFKENIEDGTNYYENYSVGENPLFGLNEMLQEGKMSDITIPFLKESMLEIDKLILKFKFVKGYLNNYKEQLEDYAILLDEEYKEMSSCYSLKGTSFIDMLSDNYGFNHVVDYTLDYAKNVKEINTEYLKASDLSESVEHYITYPDKTSLMVNFKKAELVKEIYLELHSNLTISIYGYDSNGNTEPLFLNADSSQKLFINTLETEYTKLLIVANGNIKEYFKYFDVFSNVESDEMKRGYLFRTINNLLELNEIYFVSDSSSELYSYDLETYREVIRNIVKDEENTIAKYINDRYKIEKNTKIELNDISNLYILEFLDSTVEKTQQLKIYGKES